jgi:F0F1-type ATP synthase assembly protein I
MDMRQGVIMIGGALLGMIGIFLRSRVTLGIPVFTVTPKEKAEFTELRREFSIRKLLARFIGGVGSVCFIGGFVASFQGSADWRISVEMVLIGLILVFFAVLLVRSSK